MESCEYLKFGVQAGGMANTLGAVLATHRIVPPMSAAFQRDSNCPRSGEVTYV